MIQQITASSRPNSCQENKLKFEKNRYCLQFSVMGSMPCTNKNGQSTLMAQFNISAKPRFINLRARSTWSVDLNQRLPNSSAPVYLCIYISVDVSKGVNKRQTWPVYERPFCFIRRVWFHRLCVGSNFQHGFLQSKTLLLFGIHATPKQTRASTNQILQFRLGLTSVVTSVALISPSLATVLRDRLCFQYNCHLEQAWPLL